MANPPRHPSGSWALLVLNERRDGSDVVGFERVSCPEKATGDETGTDATDYKWKSTHSPSLEHQKKIDSESLPWLIRALYLVREF